ncbi:MAG: hypothetical protein P0S95_06795 [Rhabdochlamydiaceae bacterium]|nr:hypothetical protein [Candidatus Amphrikana amoebophyrae]
MANQGITSPYGAATFAVAGMLWFIEKSIEVYAGNENGSTGEELCCKIPNLFNDHCYLYDPVTAHCIRSVDSGLLALNIVKVVFLTAGTALTVNHLAKRLQTRLG